MLFSDTQTKVCKAAHTEIAMLRMYFQPESQPKSSWGVTEPFESDLFSKHNVTMPFWKFGTFSVEGINVPLRLKRNTSSWLICSYKCFFHGCLSGQPSSWKLIQHAWLQTILPSLFLFHPFIISLNHPNSQHISDLSTPPSTSIPQSSPAPHTSTSTSFHPSIRRSTSPSRSSAWRASHSGRANWL